PPARALGSAVVVVLGRASAARLARARAPELARDDLLSASSAARPARPVPGGAAGLRRAGRPARGERRAARLPGRAPGLPEVEPHDADRSRRAGGGAAAPSRHQSAQIGRASCRYIRTASED